jgi:HSP20 family molecular chaperone IbpA
MPLRQLQLMAWSMSQLSRSCISAPLDIQQPSTNGLQLNPRYVNHGLWWVQTEQEVQVHADLPGMKKEEIDIDIDNNVLTLKVNHDQKKEKSHTDDPKEGGATWHRTESSRVFVKRSIMLPEATDTASGKASYNDGVLSIHFFEKKRPSQHPPQSSKSPKHAAHACCLNCESACRSCRGADEVLSCNQAVVWL